MRSYRLLALVFLVVAIVAACQAAPPSTAAPAMPTGTPKPKATDTAAPTNTFAPSPAPEPVEFVLQITGDPYPLASPSG